MKYIVTIVLFISIKSGFSSPTAAILNKDVAKVANGDAVLPVEDSNLNANDPTIVFSDPINSATKLLYDLDAHVQQFIPSEISVSNDEVGSLSTSEPITSEPSVYSAINSELELALSRQGDSVGALVTQLDTLQKRIQDTVTELSNRRRYILSAMLRPMLNSVRRIRSNVVRIQTQLTSIQSAATSTGNRPNAQTLGAADQGAIDGIRRRVDDIQKRIGDIIGRITSTLSIPGNNTTRPLSAQSGQNSSSGSSGR